jgi:F0F1-type ATP synthase assembly protein I
LHEVAIGFKMVPHEPDEKPREAEQEDSGSGWYALASVGFEFAVAIGVFGWIGWLLDNRWHTLPWLTVVGLAIGLIVGFWILFRAVRQSFKD